MNTIRLSLSVSVACLAAACAAGTACLGAAVRFTASIDAAQETTPSTSTATGTAELLYDIATNRFDLAITLTDFSNTLTASHIHEGAVGVPGSVVTTLGGEDAYVRSGNTLTARFTELVHGGDPSTLIRGNAYLNFHSAQFPGGEIRGQLVTEPIVLTAILTGDQEVPSRETDAYGAAMAEYNPLTNKITTHGFIYNFTNTLSASHIHEAPAGVNGSVRTNFGGAAAYVKSGDTYTQVFAELDWGGSPVSIFNEGAYYNVHSSIYPGGEIRGQFRVASEATSRLINISARGHVGAGDSVLISGFVVGGPDPVPVLVTALGPTLADFGVDGVLADPTLSVYDSANRVLFVIDDQADAPLQGIIADSGFAPANPAEPAVVLLLPPGAYTTVISGKDGAEGNALAEVYDLTLE